MLLRVWGKASRISFPRSCPSTQHANRHTPCCSGLEPLSWRDCALSAQHCPSRMGLVLKIVLRIWENTNSSFSFCCEEKVNFSWWTVENHSWYWQKTKVGVSGCGNGETGADIDSWLWASWLMRLKDQVRTACTTRLSRIKWGGRERGEPATHRGIADVNVMTSKNINWYFSPWSQHTDGRLMEAHLGIKQSSLWPDSL